MIKNGYSKNFYILIKKITIKEKSQLKWTAPKKLDTF